MKRILLALLALLPTLGVAQTLVNCAPATPCTQAGPSNTGTGDQAWLAFGKLNSDNIILGPLYSSPAGSIFGVTGSTGPAVALTTLPFTLAVNVGGTGATTLTGPIKGNGTSAMSAAAASDITGLWTGSCSASNFLRGDGACAAPVTATGSPASGNLAKFSGTTSVTNGDLSGDCTTSGALATTCNTVLGGATPARQTDLQVFTVAGANTWTKPAGTPRVTYVFICGGGGGGGSGADLAATTAGSGGGGGGGAGCVFDNFATASLGATETVTVGAAGTGGGAVSSTGAGNNGTNGGATTFGTTAYIFAGGGGFGQGGQSGAVSTGGGGGSGVASATGLNGQFVNGGSGANGQQTGFSSGSGGGGGASGAAGPTGGALGSALGGSGGGGAGGGVNASTTAFAGGNGSITSTNTSGFGGGAVCTGGTASSLLNSAGYSGAPGGGGGGGCTSATAGTGGAGINGSGGGGGGSGDQHTSGAGGAGGGGYAVVQTYY